MTDWAERDARREFHERVMADQRAAKRERLAGLIEPVFADADEFGWSHWETALAAIDALEATGVVFARMSKCDD